MKWIAQQILTLAMISASTACTIEPLLNRVENPGPYQVPGQVQKLHQDMFIADLHADPLLWNRDLNKRGSYGHVDVPRLLDGAFSLQVFAMATKTPWGLNMESNDDDSDMLVANTFIMGWPSKTWDSPFQRALYQIEKLERFAAESNGAMEIIRSRADLERIAAQQPKRTVGALLALEGAHALEGKITNLDILHDRGLRMLGPAHFFDNKAGGSAHGINKGGLTEWGRELIERAERANIVIDVAHSSAAAIDDIAAIARLPLVVSHTGVRGTCDNQRNLADRHIRAVAETGGIIGVAMFAPAICELTIAEVARSMKYVADLVGVQHVASGSDFDGATKTVVDAAGMALLTQELLGLGFTTEDVSLMMGGNVLRVLRQTLPVE